MCDREKKHLKIITCTVVIFIAFRFSLSVVLTQYVSNVLRDLPGYYTTAGDVKIHLIRGAYEIDSLKVFKVNGHDQIPFINIPKLELSIVWRRLFRGELAGQILFEKPVVNFIADKKKQVGFIYQSGDDLDWSVFVGRLMPFKVYDIHVEKGSVAFLDLTSQPNVNILFEDVKIVLQNQSTDPVKNELLPSHLLLHARFGSTGLLALSMKLNACKPMPDLDMDLKLENADARTLEDFFQAYTGTGIERTAFNLYSEIVVLDGKVNGYINPLFHNQTLTGGDIQEKSLNSKFQNVSNNLSTRIPLKGKISRFHYQFWPRLWNIFRSAFVDAFNKNNNGEIAMATKRQLGENDILK